MHSHFSSDKLHVRSSFFWKYEEESDQNFSDSRCCGLLLNPRLHFEVGLARLKATFPGRT